LRVVHLLVGFLLDFISQTYDLCFFLTQFFLGFLQILFESCDLAFELANLELFELN
jgi:hypothetical protein